MRRFDSLPLISDVVVVFGTIDEHCKSDGVVDRRSCVDAE